MLVLISFSPCGSFSFQDINVSGFQMKWVSVDTTRPLPISPETHTMSFPLCYSLNMVFPHGQHTQCHFHHAIVWICCPRVVGTLCYFGSCTTFWEMGLDEGTGLLMSWDLWPSPTSHPLSASCSTETWQGEYYWELLPPSRLHHAKCVLGSRAKENLLPWVGSGNPLYLNNVGRDWQVHNPEVETENREAVFFKIIYGSRNFCLQ